MQAPTARVYWSLLHRFDLQLPLLAGLDHPLEELGKAVSDSSLASCNTPHGFSHRVEVKSHVDPRSIEECENLLETYFMQVCFG